MIMFPDGKKKALTLSYDDGVEQDRRLVEILNRYGIKATFNINSGVQTGASAWQNGKLIEEFCKIISGRVDIAYCTNAEAFGL